MLPRRLLPFVACSLLACSSADTLDVGVSEQRIVNGQLDTTHQSVVFLYGDVSGCTGTIIKITGKTAYILTAAHCFGPGPIKQVFRGDDVQNFNAIMQVTSYKIHPLYKSGSYVFDFAMIKAEPADESWSVILPLAPAEDVVKQGVTVEHVGYGLIAAQPDKQTTKRHHTLNTVSFVEPGRFAYDQPNSGPCRGDSGGPSLVKIGAGERVAGVISFGLDKQCKSTGVSGRVTSVYDEFIVPYVGGLPPPNTSSATSTAATTTTTSGAGGASPTTGTTTGGAGAGTSWTAGDLKPKSHGGTILTSGCAVANRAVGNRGRSSAPLPRLALLGLLTFATLRRRRG
jgi:secreted trypsin-like serine protease